MDDVLLLTAKSFSCRSVAWLPLGEHQKQMMGRRFLLCLGEGSASDARRQEETSPNFRSAQPLTLQHCTSFPQPAFLLATPGLLKHNNLGSHW